MQLHPDKNLDDPDAGAKFARLGEAWNVLKDEARRGEYDAQIRARVERKRKLGQQDDERKRMRAKLEEGERRATDRTNAQQAARHSDEEARLKLAAEVKNLQKMFYRPPPSRPSAAASADEFYAAEMARSAAAAAATSASAASEDDGGADAVDASLTLSVRWDSSGQGGDAVAPPTEAQLRSAFEAYGVVDSIAVSAKRALVSFADAGGLENCLAFSGAQHGFRLARLGAAGGKSAAAASSTKGRASPPRATVRSATPPVAATNAAPQPQFQSQPQSQSHLSYEQQTLARMKALAEKRKADKLKSEAAGGEPISSAPP
jgi:curved DNA-binding protein CbpA